MSRYIKKAERDHRCEIVEVCRRMYAKDFIVATDGNVSVRLGGNKILATPSGLHKGFMKVEDLIITDMKGKKISGTRMPSSELRMHLKVYRERPDIHAVVHAHPPVSTAFTIAGLSLAKCVLPEVVMTMGGIPTTRYAMPTSHQGPEVIEEFIGECDAMLLDRHGTLTVGATLQEAFNKLEKVEHTAQITMMARQLGHVRTLEPEEIHDLLKTRDTLGLKGKVFACSNCGACGRGSGKQVCPENNNREENAEKEERLEKIVSVIKDRVSEAFTRHQA